MRTTLPALVVTGILTLGLSSALVAQSVVLPILEIVDSEGDTIGPVTGFQAELDIPIIRFVDTQVGAPLLLRVFGKSWLRGYLRDTYFADDGCQGSAFHFGLDPFALNDLSGWTYSVARSPGGGAQMLFRSDATEGGTFMAYKSRFDSGFDLCNETDASQTIRPAVLVMNLDSEFPPDYELRPVD